MNNNELSAGANAQQGTEADNTTSSKTIGNTLVGRSLSDNEQIVNLYKAYIEKALSATTKHEFREGAAACGAIFDSARILGTSQTMKALRQVMYDNDFLFTQYGKPDEGHYLVKALP